MFTQSDKTSTDHHIAKSNNKSDAMTNLTTFTEDIEHSTYYNQNQAYTEIPHRT